jgi:hypothetical protein
MDPTYLITQREQAQERAELEELIASLCWKPCPDCHGRGYRVEHWPDDKGGPDYILRPTCTTCHGQREIWVADPNWVGVLLQVADLARVALPANVDGRMERALDLAVTGAVTLHGDGATVHSQNGHGEYHVNGYNCSCLDAGAPLLGSHKLCKHKIAYWLVVRARRVVEEQAK